MDYFDMKDLIKNNDVISFDIFDTLIKRDLPSPIDVFKIAYKIISEDASDFEVKMFIEDRIQAEIKARKITDKEEVSFKEIYNQLEKKYGNKSQLIMESEVYVEKKVCVFNPTVKEIYDYAIKLNKEIIITSDMYLDLDVIESILEKNGYHEYENIFLSSELDKTKSTGRLFKIVKQKYKRKNIIHIGDNYKSDYINAKKNGINSFYIPINDNKLRHSSRKNNKILDKFINNRLSNSNYFYNIGYECLGPLLFGYVNWIHAKDRNEKKFFLARDGHVMMEAYLKCFPSDDVKYVYASRRGLIVPSLNKYKNIEDMISHIFLGKYISVEDVLLKLGVKKENIPINDNKLNRKYKSISYMLNDEKAKKLLDSFYDEIVNNSKEEEKLIKEYYEKLSFKNDVSIIDIGWFGNMQHALKLIFQDECNITGYYIGVRENEEKNKQMNGYIFDSNTKSRKYSESTRTYTDLLETFFSYNEGSFIKLKKKDDAFLPVLKTFEYNELDYQNVIGQIQEGGLCFVNDFKDSIIKDYVNFNEHEAFSRINDLGINPNIEDIDKFRKFFGDNLLSSKGITRYILNPRQFLYDFSKSWKTGFLLNIFRVNLPYYRAYSIFNCIVRKIKSIWRKL